MSNDHQTSAADRLADALMEVAGDQNVRTLEALAAALVARRRAMPGDPSGDADPLARAGLQEARSSFAGERYELCRRIARRALGGTLADLVAGATAFHRIEADPPWARRLLPIAVFGSFLFYRPSASGETALPPSASGAEHGTHSQQGPEIERVLDVPGRSPDDGRE